MAESDFVGRKILSTGVTIPLCEGVVDNGAIVWLARVRDDSACTPGVVLNQSQAGLNRKSKQELLAFENHWLQVENDPDALEAILAPDFLHVVPAGIITKDEQLNFMRQHPAPQQSQERHFEDLHIRIYGNVGIVNGVVVREGGGA